jgi:hypothetical protein
VTGTSFCVYHSGGPESSFGFREPRGVFTPEMSGIFVAHRPGGYLILTDSMSSIKGPADSKSCSRDSLVGI